MMASNTRTHDSTLSNKPRPRKRRRGVSHADEPFDTSPLSFFDLMPEEQVERAIEYYYDHPEQMPYRLSGAHQRASQRPLQIKVKFDEKIFERKVQLRPIPDCELEGVDPFSLGPAVETDDGEHSSTEPDDGNLSSASTSYVRPSFIMGDLLHGPRDYGCVQTCGQTDKCSI